MLNIQPFIFNWNNQFEKTCKIEADLLAIFDKVNIINSDDNKTKNGWTNIGNQSYFTKLIKK